jgi:membrane protease subunit (stomatin/prohibitin family)
MSKTNVIEWPSPGTDDVLYRYPYEDLRTGSQLVVREFETAIFLRDGKLYDVFQPGRHVLTTNNIPLLTRAYRLLGGYGETPFKAQVIFIALKQVKGKFGLNMRIRLSDKSTWMTELQTFGDYWFRVSDPSLFLTQMVGGVGQFTSDSVSVFIRDFLTQQTMQNFSSYDAIKIYNNLNAITPSMRMTLGEEFKNRGLELMNVQFGEVRFPLLEKMEKEDPTYGLPIMAAIQSGDGDKVLETVKIVESMRGLGKSSGAGLAAGIVGIPYIFGAPPYQAQQPAQQQAPPQPAQQVQPQQVDYMSKLKELKEAFDGGLISKEEYDSMKAELLAKWKGSS